jgi:putative heme transporter
MVGLFPQVARDRVDSSGRVAWTSLTAFVRATVIVAFVDAIGIMLIALILKVPLAVPIGVLVFLGAFVPIVGALVSGFVAVIVALVAHGPVVALLMLAGVLLVQQLESHVLQPFLLGRAVSVHPLAVILAVASGVLVAGIVGALVAVPIAASLNVVVRHLASTRADVDPEQAEERAEAEAGPLT